MKAFADIPLKRKLILITMLTNIVALLVASAFFAAIQVKSLRDAKVRETAVLAQVVGINTIAALLKDDKIAAEKILTALSAQSHVTAAVLYDKYGEVFAQYKRKDVDNFSRQPVQDTSYRLSSNHLGLFEKIIVSSNHQKIGTLYIQSDLEGINQLVTKYAGIIGVVLLISSLIALLLSAKLQTVISLPLLQLVKTANAVTQKSDYRIRAQHYGNDELGTLVDAFNEMLVQIQNREKRWAQTQAQLEEQVRLRTAQLSEIPSDLEEKVEHLQNATETVGFKREERIGDANTQMSADLAQKHPLRILLAEDNLTNQKVALLLLKRMGYSADIVENGVEAVEAVMRQPVDVILMDVQMPEMDGIEATKRIRQCPFPAKSCYIVAMTAHATLIYKEKCLKAGMDGYITKPVRPNELMDALIRGFQHKSVVEHQSSIISTQKWDNQDSRCLEVQETENSSPKTELIPEPDNSIESEALQVQLRTALYDLAGKDEPEIVNELIQIYLDSGAKLTANLQAAIAEQNPAKLEQAAHSLKSHSASFGAATLADLCGQLEQQGRAGNTSDAVETVERVLSEYALVGHQLSFIMHSTIQETKKLLTVNSPPTTEESENALAWLVQEIKNTLTDFIGEEPEIIHDLVQTYRADAKKLINDLCEATAQGDANTIAQVAHSLKSSSAHLGANRLASLSFSLEKQGKAGDLTDASAQLAQIEAEYSLVDIALERISGSLSEIMP
jgi:CheY-like chemotaxis protein